ncbi:unnamed protein product [Meganyctiphanes norvegica]|uniref:Gustatory receptor n=1 Tax=Meganyctiphanes norvegica TaxID=48144 RepID=A0AAV2RHA2_MEGNR
MCDNKDEHVFSLTEDCSQMTLQILFFMRADSNFADGIVDKVSWFSVVISCFSLSKNYAEYRITQDSSASGLLIFTTTFLSVAGRVLLCCVITMALEFLWVFYPVLAAVTLQIILAFPQFCFSLCRKFIAQNWLCPKKSTESLELRDINNHMKPNKQSFDFTFPDIPQRSANAEGKQLKISNVAYTLGTRLQSLLFSVTVDGHSHLGLWSSALYATLALWFRMVLLSRNDLFHILLDQFMPTDDNDEDICKIALTFTMLSFTMNTIVVLLNGQHRNISLLVSVLFIIFPIYLCTLAALQNKDLWAKIYSDTVDDRIFHNAIDILIPITTVAGLVILINITAIAKALKTEKEHTKRKDYLLQKMKMYTSNNEGKNKNHTI